MLNNEKKREQNVPRSKNHKAKQTKNRTRTTALEKSVA